MTKKLVKVCPQIIDLKDPETGYHDNNLTNNPDRYLKLDNNENSISPSEGTLDNIHKAIDTSPLNHFPDRDSRKLRRALSHYTGNSYNSISCFGNQASALDCLARTYLRTGLDAIITWPDEGYMGHYMSAAGARVINAQFKELFKPRIEEMINSITQKTRMIFISNPNPITGAIFSEAELVFLLSYAANIMVVIDESFFEYSGCTVSSMADNYPNLIVIRSFSAAFSLAGFDTSYIITDPDNLHFINRLAIGKQPNALAQAAALAALDDTKHLKQVLYKTNESKKMLYNYLTTLGFEFTISPANFITIKTSQPDKLTDVLSENNIYVKQMTKYPGLENYIRITIGSPEQTGILIDILSLLHQKRKTKQANRLVNIKRDFKTA